METDNNSTQITNKAQEVLGAHYDRCLMRYGDTAKGADWPNENDRKLRYDIMLDLALMRETGCFRLGDIGCGTGGLYERIQERALNQITYFGLDISSSPLSYAREKHPEIGFMQQDILSMPGHQLEALGIDYFVLNGVFTEKQSLSNDEMWLFVQAMLEKLWPATKKGLAFNVMSSHVDYERPELFHLPYDRLFSFAHSLAGRNVTIRADYGLYEYTCYLYKDFDKTEVLEEQSESSTIQSDAYIPVCNPLLPKAEEIYPYLKNIDKKRWYTNFGPLNTEFENRIKSLSAAEGGVDCVATGSGTAAITSSIIATIGRSEDNRRLCLMPSFTFAGSVSAVIDAGYTPYFVDIDPASFMLTPELLLHHKEIGNAGMVLVVGAFGTPVSQKEWMQFQEATGVQVIIDAAACFGSVTNQPSEYIGEIPVAISFHATKVLGIGEGGCVLSTNKSLISECRRALNFGFLGDRNSRIPGINGKLSEYEAAVGLAGLDAWPKTQTQWVKVAKYYRDAFREHTLSTKLISSLDYPSSYIHFMADNCGQADALSKALKGNDIDTRRWWEFGCAEQEAYAHYSRDDLTSTRKVAERLVGLPAFVDLDFGTIKRISRIIGDIISRF